MKPILDHIFGLLPFGIGAPILITVGFTLLADEFKLFDAARVCFYLATAWIYGEIFMWTSFTSDRFYVRRIVTFLVCGFVGIGFMESLRLTKHREAKTNIPKSSENSPSSQSTSPGNSGAIPPLTSPQSENHRTESNAVVSPETSKPPLSKSHEVSSAVPVPKTDTLQERQAFLGRLTKLYIATHDNISSEIMAGFELAPEDWLNGQLAKEGKTWRVEKGRIVSARN